jgi:hypothetical protein
MIHELTGGTSTDVAAMATGADARLVRGVVKRCTHTHQRFFGGT